MTVHAREVEALLDAVVRDDVFGATAALARCGGVKSEAAGEAAFAAARSGSVAVLRWLLEAGVTATIRSAPNYNPEISADTGSTPLLVSAASSGSRECVEMLLDRGAEIDEGDGTNWSALHSAACSERRGAVLALLIARGARVDAVAMGGTPLMAAVKSGCVRAVRTLVAAGADVRKASWDGTTAAQLAAGKAEMTAALGL